LTPQTGIKLDTTDEIREYARTYILPMITSASAYPSLRADADTAPST
jgi:hypothetical protein